MCQVMQNDFLNGVTNGRYNEEGEEYYSDGDLLFGLNYALGYKEEGYAREPTRGYSLNDFILWCRDQLTQIPPNTKTYTRQMMLDKIEGLRGENKRIEEQRPYWMWRFMLELFDGGECHYPNDRCDSSEDCITEWCEVCAAKAFLRDIKRREH